MSFLWSGKIAKTSDKKAKPSPTCNDFFLDSAQGPGDFTNSINKYLPITNRSIERISLLASAKRNMVAGMTVETALVLPLFLFFLLSFGSVIEMIRLHGNMQLALWEVGKEAALYAYAVEERVVPEGEESWWRNFGEKVLASTFLKWRVVEAVGEDYLNKSPVVGGSDGLVLWESDIVKPNGEMEMVVTYGVESLSSMIGFPYFRMANRYYGHGWTGYQLPEQQAEEVTVVYVTDNAEVYHLYRDCTHLNLTVRTIREKALESARNLYGGRYEACEKCGAGNMPALLYIADEGECYHYERTCPGLKRTVYTVRVEDADTLPLCGRCKGREEQG